MEAQLQDEIERLEDLREINDHVRPEEIAAVRQQKTDLKPRSPPRVSGWMPCG